MYIYIYIYTYTYTYTYSHGQFSKVQSGKMGPAPGRFAFSRWQFEVTISNGSGI